MVGKALILMLALTLALGTVIVAVAQDAEPLIPPFDPPPMPLEEPQEVLPVKPVLEPSASTLVSSPVEVRPGASGLIFGKTIHGVPLDRPPKPIPDLPGFATSSGQQARDGHEYTWEGIATVRGESYRVFEDMIYLGDLEIDADPLCTAVRMTPHLVPHDDVGGYLALVLEVGHATPPGKAQLLTYGMGQWHDFGQINRNEWYRFQMQIVQEGPPYTYRFWYAEWDDQIGDWVWHLLDEATGTIDSNECRVYNMIEHVWELGGHPSVHGYCHTKNMYLARSSGGSLWWNDSVPTASIDHGPPLGSSVSVQPHWPDAFCMGLWSNYDSLDTTFLTGYNYFSFPLDPIPVTWEPGEQLGDDIPELSIIWRYNAQTQGWEVYIPGVGGFSPDIGQHGYAVSVSVNRSVDAVGPIADYDEFQISMFDQYNLLGHPFDFIVDKEDLLIEYGGQTVSWQQAVANNWVYDIIQWYDPQLGGYRVINELHPWYGYWVYPYVDCSLVVPPVVKEGT